MRAVLAILTALLLAIGAGCGDEEEPANEAGEAYASEVEEIVEGTVNPAATSALDALLNVKQGGAPGEAEGAVADAARDLAGAEAALRKLDPPSSAAEAATDLADLTEEFATFLDSPPASDAEATSFARIEAVEAYDLGIGALADAVQDLATAS